jgi:hypothetical protein
MGEPVSQSEDLESDLVFCVDSRKRFLLSIEASPPPSTSTKLPKISQLKRQVTTDSEQEDDDTHNGGSSAGNVVSNSGTEVFHPSVSNRKKTIGKRRQQNNGKPQIVHSSAPTPPTRVEIYESKSFLEYDVPKGSLVQCIGCHVAKEVDQFPTIWKPNARWPNGIPPRKTKCRRCPGLV